MSWSSFCPTLHIIILGLKDVQICLFLYRLIVEIGVKERSTNVPWKQDFEDPALDMSRDAKATDMVAVMIMHGASRLSCKR